MDIDWMMEEREFTPQEADLVRRVLAGPVPQIPASGVLRKFKSQGGDAETGTDTDLDTDDAEGR